MARTMECLEIAEWGGELERATREIPPVHAGEVRLEIVATSVGLTVRNVIRGDLGNEPHHLPRIPGHEVIGHVDEVGAGVRHVESGDLVAAYFYLSCGHCDACYRGKDSLCERLDGLVSVDIDGGFSEYVTLPAGNAIGLPDGIDPVEATVVPDAAGTPYHVMNQRMNVKPNDHVLVLGAGGGVGIHLVQMAQLFGAHVTAVDLIDEKLEKCAQLGAVHTINTSHTSLGDAIGDIGVAYAGIVDLTGATDVLEEAVDHLAPRGRLVNLTTFPGATIETSPREQVFGELEVIGSRYCSKFELLRTAHLVATGQIEPVISDVVDLADVPDLLARIEDGSVIGRGAMTT